MKKNTVLGLVIMAVVIIVALVLWRLYFSSHLQVGPGPAVTTTPSVAPPAAVAPPAETPEVKQQPAVPPIKVEPSPGIAPLQEPESKITIPPPPAMKEHFGILVGSYRKYQDAAKMLAKMKQQGKPGFVQKDPRNPNLFQVWLGPFSSQDNARAAGKDIQAMLKKPFKIEQIENPVPK